MFSFLIICVIVILILCLILERCSRVEEFEKIPGPKGYSLIGNGFDFLIDTVRCFYYFRFLASEYKDLYKLKLGPKKIVMVHNPEDVEILISGSKNTSKGFFYKLLKPWLREGLLVSNGEKWRQRRKILTPAFHFNILQSYKTVFEESSRNFVEKLSKEVGKPKTDITSYITDCTLSAICETAMGMKLDPQTSESSRKYKDAIQTLGEVVIFRGQRFWYLLDPIFSMFSGMARQQTDTLELLGSFRDKVINKRRQDGPRLQTNGTLQDNPDDESNLRGKKRLAMLDLLLLNEREGTIDADGIKEEVDTFMFEGHDTTATCLQFTFMVFANNPEAQEKAFQECNNIFGSSDRTATMEDLNQMKYLECCIKESLRLYPPVYFIIRRIDQDFKLRDFLLPAGSDLLISMYDLHRRPDQFVEPLEFRPERFMTEPTWHPYSYIPFSAGPRNCIGQRFAMIEMKLILSTVLRNYRLLPFTTPLDLVYFSDFILRVKEPIYVKIERRH